MTETIFNTYTLQVVGPRYAPWEPSIRFADGAFPLGKYLRETEENLTDLLPPGYEVRIREWDAKEEHPQ